MAMYKYLPLDLDGPSIRLLRLLKGNHTDDIQCDLFEGWLKGSIPYEAVSYTWGCAEKPARITVNGSAMYVTFNAYEALKKIRSRDQDRYLWIDAICINQDDKQEQGHQVQQMRHIYQESEQVIVWLGQGTEETNLVMDFMKGLHDTNTKKEGDWKRVAQFQINLCSPRCREGMESILSRPWFRRIWILQEIANARFATILCGNRSVSASTFAQVPALLGLQPNSHCQAVLDIMPGRLRKESWWNDKRDLYTLLRKFRNGKATDERDIIYALLGISSDACESENLLPDYNKSLCQVIQDTTSFLLFHTHLDNSLYEFPTWTLLEFLQSLDSLSSAVLKNAINNKHEDVVKLLLETGKVDVDSKDEWGQTPLHRAVENGHEGIIKLLLETSKVDVDFKNKWGQTPLYRAAENGHEGVVKLLLETGKVDVDFKNKWGQTPLYRAVENGHEGIVKLLLETGKVDVDFKDKWGQTPLYRAAEKGHEGVIKLLLETSKVDVDFKNKWGKTPLYRTVENGHEGVVKLLLETGKVDVDFKNKWGQTPLYRAVENGHEGIVKLLLETNKVDVDLNDK